MSDEFGGFDDDFIDETEGQATVAEVEVETEEEKPVEKIKKIQRVKKVTKIKANPKSSKQTPREKFVNKVLKKAGIDELPDTDVLYVFLRGKSNATMKVSDIAFFLNDENEDEVLTELAGQCPLRNTVNLSADVEMKNVENVAKQILEAGKMYMPIEVTELQNGSKQLECWSGRHRLALIGLLYGPDVEVPVYVTQMTTREARDAVIYANSARKTRGLEAAEHTVLSKTEGSASKGSFVAMYNEVATNKTAVYDLAVYLTAYDKKTLGFETSDFGFSVSKTASRKDAEATMPGVKGYFRSIYHDWTKKMTADEYMDRHAESVSFLNTVVRVMQQNPDYEAKQHCSTQALSALGTFYCDLEFKVPNGSSPIDYADKVANALVSLGDIGRAKTEEIRSGLKKAFKKN